MRTLTPHTRVYFTSTRSANTAELEIDGHPARADVLERIRAFVAELLRTEYPVPIDVDLSDGARDGLVYVYQGARTVITGQITRTMEEPSAADVGVVYPSGEPVLPGDVVLVGRLGSAFHEVVEISETDAWLRECAGRHRTSTEPIGRLRFVERAFG